ncbi:MAG: hypothetical protein AAF393_16990 [Pseudomonadota bacterium]
MDLFSKDCGQRDYTPLDEYQSLIGFFTFVQRQADNLGDAELAAVCERGISHCWRMSHVAAQQVESGDIHDQVLN